MRFLHISDLHLGKRLFEFSLSDDQSYILNEIINIADTSHADAVIISGDIYDKPIPLAEAVTLFDRFLNKLITKNKKIFIISGNHDSQERLEFGSRLMAPSGVYVESVFKGVPSPVVLSDEYGEINVWLLPFIKTHHVKHSVEGLEPENTDEAVKSVIKLMNPDFSKRNIIAAHQFTAGGAMCDSEDLLAGGSDSVSPEAFKAFDYAALGHLHSPQTAGKDTIRYCGSPLKYSLSEISKEKNVVIADILEKGRVKITLIPLNPLRDVRKIKGSFDEIVRLGEKDEYRDDYIAVTLTDEDEIQGAISRLRTVYPRILKLDYDNQRTKERKIIESDEEFENKSPFELISWFYSVQNSRPLSEYQERLIKELLPDGV